MPLWSPCKLSDRCELFLFFVQTFHRLGTTAEKEGTKVLTTERFCEIDQELEQIHKRLANLAMEIDISAEDGRKNRYIYHQAAMTIGALIMWRYAIADRLEECQPRVNMRRRLSD